MDTQMKEPITERQARIVEIVTQQGFATIDNLARDFGVSAQSVRRDIIRLDAEGMLQRFHGGVGVRETSVRLGYAEKRTVAADAKQRIAAKAASLIPDGSVVFLDVGTTVEAVARELAGKRRLHVFTASLAAATILSDHPAIDLFVIGGSVRGVDGSLVGETTLSTLSRFRFDYAVIGFSGIDRDGAFMDYDIEKVGVKQAAMEQAGHSFVVGDSSKFRKSAIVRFSGRPDSLSLVTEMRPPAEVLEVMQGLCIIAE
ncbi:MAG: DeoR/GlpR family DNA-binding transcription regulator [Aquamicrobium sp.]|uniref:DeoR/GlpR family DNA-binding transcription regulator n=1 Tax=Aquamicrobium sp. TaxID=1872579 RepID=UPI00349EA606|nr:DeoR/GlpR family DNA-binding transcription regulator [Aquamicrobium sp.]